MSLRASASWKCLIDIYDPSEAVPVYDELYFLNVMYFLVEQDVEAGT